MDEYTELTSGELAFVAGWFSKTDPQEFRKAVAAARASTARQAARIAK